MRTLSFLGTGGGLSANPNNSYFNYLDGIVFIDLSLLHYEKVLKLIKGKEFVSVVLTHMHDDHCSGIPTLALYMQIVLGQKLEIIVPNALIEDVKSEMSIKGVDEDWYYLTDLDKEKVAFIMEYIPVKHTPTLDGKCFGYKFCINKKKIIYTGDTDSLNYFYDALNGGCDEFYSEMSKDDYGVHLCWEKEKENIKRIAENTEVYLMHFDYPDYFIKKKFENNIKIVN